ncbi:hypothetical protein [Arthrobacter sp.]
MSTPTPRDPGQEPRPEHGEGTPPVPDPPKFGQRLPEPQHGSGAGSPANQPGPTQPAYGAYGQPGPGAPSGYGQPGQPNLPPLGQGFPQQQHYGYPQQPFGGPGAPGGAAGPRPARPGTVTAAFWLIMAAGLITLIQGLVLVLVPDSVILDAVNQAMSTQDPAMDKELRDAGLDMASLIGPMKIAVLFIMIIGAGIYALIAAFIRKGSNGARITGTVLAVISLVGLLSAFDPLAFLAIALGVAGIVCAWLRPSSEFIGAVALHKHGGFRQ